MKKNNKILICGLGSIGQRHALNLIDLGYKDLVFTPWKDEYTPAIEEEMQIRTVMQIIYMQNYSGLISQNHLHLYIQIE